jgi:uncharacterized membrane protein
MISVAKAARSFAEATIAADLASFDGAGAGIADPIRVYVGLRSAETAEDRADLAVREFERTGAFDRAVLVVTTVTGTGWVDPDAAAAVENLHSGGTAMVAMQ